MPAFKLLMTNDLGHRLRFNASMKDDETSPFCILRGSGELAIQAVVTSPESKSGSIMRNHNPPKAALESDLSATSQGVIEESTASIPASLISPLTVAGWRPHRNCGDQLRLPESPAAFPVAQRILREFGGLRFGHPNEHIVLDPLGAIDGDPELLARCEKAVGRVLYPLGYQEHQDREAILVDQDGAIYLNFGDGYLHLLAGSFEASLPYLVCPGNPRVFASTLKRAGNKRWLVEP
jgi:hypothetical protein